jgi:hypothetical protein
MQHSIISWDSSYRDFFHLIDALAAQNYPQEEYELIYVEQRSQKHANEYATAEGVKSLSERAEEVQEELDITVEYLSDSIDKPYHLGKCVNRGLDLAEGTYISVMDGDQLLPPTFLRALDKFHQDGDQIANIVRRMAVEPVGVSKKNWKRADIDYSECLNLCKQRDEPIPDWVGNKGPMISTHQSAWEAVNGYSTHKIWSTGLSRLGQDVTARLENHLNVTSEPLPETVAVHPWHPTGFDRATFSNRRLLYYQKQLIRYANENNIVDWRDRSYYTDRIYRKNQNFIDKIIHRQDLALPGTGTFEEPAFWEKTWATIEGRLSVLYFDKLK